MQVYCEDEKKLKRLKNKIEKLNKQQQVKIMEIFMKKNIQFTENKNGIFINLNKIPLKIMDEISKYLDYIGLQEKSLNKLEQTKKEIEKQYFEDVNSISVSTSPM
tara:strand:+ start:3184 stop:3498 length:315 start_codon:yes stop_codon:yes gene_type:complete